MAYLHPGTFHQQTTKMAAGRHLGVTASVSPRHLGTTACYLADPFSSFADQYEWFCSPLHRHQSVGTSDESEVGFTWLLSGGKKFPDANDHADATEHPLSGRGMGWCGKILAGHGIPYNSAKHHHGVQKGLWPDGSMGASPPRSLPISREGSPQTCAAGGWKHRLGICLCLAKWGLSHVSLSSKGHISAMMDGVPSMDAHGWLHQLQICKLLKHKDMVVCPEGWNGKLEALQFTFQELPLWNAATPGEPTHEPELIEVDLSSIQPESMTTAISVPNVTLVLPLSPVNTVEPPCDIAMAINLQLQGILEQLQQALPTASAPTSQHSTPKRQPPLSALGSLPSTREIEDPFMPEGMDSAIPAPVATLA